MAAALERIVDGKDCISEAFIGRRIGDASDADADVVRRQHGEPLGEVEWRRLDAAPPLDGVTADALVAIQTQHTA